MKTIQELEQYLEDNGYTFRSLTIGNHRAQEGYIIEEAAGAYQFAYSERGNKRVLQSFATEEELVHYALAQLDKSDWSKAHLLVSVYSEQDILEVEELLKSRNIKYRRNDVPNYKAGERLYRIFVFGNDLAKAKDIITPTKYR